MKQFIWIFLLGFLFTACANEVKEGTENIDEVTEDSTEATDEHADHAEDTHEPIELNDGKRWTVNEEMKPHLSEGELVLKEFLSTETPKTDYETLAADLKKANDKLIKSCTMQGKSHDELHKWLHPHLELVSELKDASEEEAENLISELQESFNNYHRHFE